MTTESDKRFIVWEAVSYAWTEIGLNESEYIKYAQKLKSEYSSWEEVERIIYRDVCASFAFESFLLIPCMLWMLLPDWGYHPAYLEKRMQKWYAKPYYRHFLNPFRIVGYPVALFLSFSFIRKLKKEFLAIKG